MSGVGSDGTNVRIALTRFFRPEIRVWRGQAPLWIVFWVYGVAVSSAIAALFFTAYDLNETAFLQALIVVSALYTIWILFGIWRCAPNSSPAWGTFARLLTVAWALNTALVLVFLQIDLLMRFGQG